MKNAAKNGAEWTTYGFTQGETRYSPLNQITTANVGRLGLSWSYNIGQGGGGQEATPLVFNGVLYNITNWSVVYAVDARTGKEKWRWDPEINQDKTRPYVCCGVVQRGVALYQNLVIAPTIDGRLIALDIQTGHPVWESRISLFARGLHGQREVPRIAKGRSSASPVRSSPFAASLTPTTRAPASEPGDFTPFPGTRPSHFRKSGA